MQRYSSNTCVIIYSRILTIACIVVSCFPFQIKTLLVWPSSQGSVFKTNSEKIRLAYYNTKLLFSSPYLRVFMFLNFLQFGSMLG